MSGLVHHGWLAWLGSVWVAGLLPGAEPPSELEANLSSPAYPTRIRSEEQLLQWAADHGDEALRWLVARSKNHPEPEARLRIASVLERVAMSQLEKQRPGFLGITMMSDELAVDGESRAVVRITFVQEGSPAAAAGLRRDDRVLELGQKRWTQADSSAELASRVGRMKPGEEVELKVLRGQDQIDLTVTLGARPWSLGTWGEQQAGRISPFSSQQRFEAMEEGAREAAFQKWLEAYEAESPRAGSPSQSDLREAWGQKFRESGW